MRPIKLVLLTVGAVIAMAGCYWAPPSTGGGLNLSIQARDLPANFYGYAVRVELFDANDINPIREGRLDGSPGPDADYYEYPTFAAAVPIGGKTYLEFDSQGASEGQITVPEIPVGVYRLRVGIWEYYIEGGLYNYNGDYFGVVHPYSEGVSEPFTISAGESADVTVSLQDTFYTYDY